jgi:hypothetical protein
LAIFDRSEREESSEWKENNENMLIKSLVLILLMTQFRAIKKVGEESGCCHCMGMKNSYKGGIQCEQIIQAIRLMNFRSFL